MLETSTSIQYVDEGNKNTIENPVGFLIKLIQCFELFSFFFIGRVSFFSRQLYAQRFNLSGNLR